MFYKYLAIRSVKTKRESEMINKILYDLYQNKLNCHTLLKYYNALYIIEVDNYDVPESILFRINLEAGGEAATIYLNQKLNLPKLTKQIFESVKKIVPGPVVIRWESLEFRDEMLKVKNKIAENDPDLFYKYEKEIDKELGLADNIIGLDNTVDSDYLKWLN